MNNLLEVTDLCVEFKTSRGTVQALDKVNIHVKKGETLGIVGESGCGKSITALSLMNLLPKQTGRISGGSILFDGQEIVGLSEKKMSSIRGNKIAMIFQEPMTSLNPVKTIGFQLNEVLIRHKQMKKKEALERTIELLKEVGISRPEKVVHNYPHELSGGMLQRIMIAMALSCEPQLLIADEPTTALDVTIQAQILELMMKLKETHDTAIMLITHNLGVVAQVCDRVNVMYAGQIVEEADVQTLFDMPKHPYTDGLMKCAPKITEVRDRLDCIEGSVPALSDYPSGCRFAGRCPHCTDYCIENGPDLLMVGENHSCRCHMFRKNENT